MASMQYIMRFNDYKNDPYSEGNPMNSICSRGDLSEEPFLGGCYDTKVCVCLRFIYSGFLGKTNALLFVVFVCVGDRLQPSQDPHFVC